jgi:hypothetical protein
MNVIKLQRLVVQLLPTLILNANHCWLGLPHRKYPQFQQDEIFGLQDAFRKLDVDDKGYVDEATAIKATQASERQPYDVVRQALKEVELDSSRRVELDDYVGVS